MRATLSPMRRLIRATLNILLVPIWLLVFLWLSLVNLCTGRDDKE